MTLAECALGIVPALVSIVNVHEVDSLPVIPESAFIQERTGDFPQASDPLQAVTVDSCAEITSFPVTSSHSAQKSDSASRLTEVYVGDYLGNRILCHMIDSSAQVLTDSLPLTYGLPLIAADFDLDGNLDLLIQRGDAGFGGNGYLDIQSKPTWALRHRFVLPGYKVEMHPILVELDGDIYPEVLCNPNSFGNGVIVVIDYNSVTGDFEIVSTLSAPSGVIGKPAAADFDNDGRMEVIWGSVDGYRLYEASGISLVDVGMIDPGHNNHCAVVCRPRTQGVIQALLGHGELGPDSFLYRLIHFTDNNQFTVDTVFSSCPGWSGVPLCSASDFDCDGRDELAMKFGCSETAVLEWNVTELNYQVMCSWRYSDYTGMVDLNPADVTWDGNPEWLAVSPPTGGYIFRIFQSLLCTGCGTDGICVPPNAACVCLCHADPVCDGVTNVQDVVAVVNVAFRGGNSEPDPSISCGVARYDLDCNTVVDIVDVVAIVNIAFRGGSPAHSVCEPCASRAE